MATLLVRVAANDAKLRDRVAPRGAYLRESLEQCWSRRAKRRRNGRNVRERIVAPWTEIKGAQHTNALTKLVTVRVDIPSTRLHEVRCPLTFGHCPCRSDRFMRPTAHDHAMMRRGGTACTL